MQRPIEPAITRTRLASIFAASILVSVATPNAVAQTPAATPKLPAAAKKSAPKQPAQPQNQQQAAQPPMVVPQLIYRSWTKLCPPKYDADPAAGTCMIFMEGRELRGALVVRATLLEVEGEAKKALIVSFVYGVDLQSGTRVVVDQGPLEATAPYVVCVPPNAPPPLFGCVSRYEINADVISGMKKGKTLTLQTLFNGQTLSPQLPLADFAKAYDGPPSEIKVETAPPKPGNKP